MPLEASEEPPVLTRSASLESSLRVGTQYLPAWRVRDVLDDTAAGLQPSVPVVLVVDVRDASVRLIDGELCHRWSASEVTSLYPGFRAAHHRIAMTASRRCASVLDARETSVSLEVDGVWTIGTSGTRERVPAYAVNGAAGGGFMGGSPSEDCSFCLPGYPGASVLPLHADSAVERNRICAIIRGASLGRPPMPCPPIFAGSLSRELPSRYWATCHAILMPAYMLLLDEPGSSWPFRVLALTGTACYISAKPSLVFTIQAERWQLRLAAPDEASLGRWRRALGDVVPIGELVARGEIVDPCRKRNPLVQEQIAFSASLVRLRTLQRELLNAESCMENVQQGADARLVAVTEQLFRRTEARGLSSLEILGPGGMPASHPIRTPVSEKMAPTPSCPPQAPTKLASAATLNRLFPVLGTFAPAILGSTASCAEHAQVQQLIDVNLSLRADIAEVDREIRLLQHAVLLLSSTDWARGEWVWFTRLFNSRTLWDVWHRAYQQHRHKCIAQEMGRNLAASTSLHAGASAQGQHEFENGRFVQTYNATSVIEEPSIWSAITGDRGIGIDSTHMACADSRRAAAAAHDEDWFISFASKLFEL